VLVPPNCNFARKGCITVMSWKLLPLMLLLAQAPRGRRLKPRFKVCPENWDCGPRLQGGCNAHRNGLPGETTRRQRQAANVSRFRISKPGQYRLSAARNGYVRSEYGARSPKFGPGLTSTLSAGQKLNELTIPLMPGERSQAVFRPGRRAAGERQHPGLRYTYQDGQRVLNQVSGNAHEMTSANTACIGSSRANTL